ncbi:MAG: nucleotide exchange factor GrpE [Candidatus Pacebacteria bacterium]|nr:nucleotide exchange factor GrpE [Candidatus Paceibacterota bacterium]MCF7857076.1 nucleotide exchange factor GrpE [Candidatus Paceibacterota bacterium]
MVHKKEKDEEIDMISEDETLTEIEDIDVETEDESLKDKLRILREKLAKTEEQKKQCQDDLQRTRADFLNSKRRLEEQLARDKERATDKILFDLLALIDSFDTAMIDTKLWESIDEKWRTGVEAIHTKLLSILKSNSVEQFDPTGFTFNPEEHEAVGSTPITNNADEEKIITVLQKGFKRNDTVIRPAKVIVGHK